MHNPHSDSSCPESGPPKGAKAVARGIARLLACHDVWLLPEFTLPNHRRVDLIGIDRQGDISIIEIKVDKADLMRDQKWTEYLDYCDRFYWGLSNNLDASLVEAEIFRPQSTGLIIADAYGGEMVRPAKRQALAPARRSKLLRLVSHNALRRHATAIDPQLLGFASG